MRIKPEHYQEKRREHAALSLHKKKQKEKVLFLLTLAATVLLALVSLFVGAYNIVDSDHGWDIFLISRIPRTLALMLAGTAMSISGLVMQLVTQNRFVEPSTTGTTEWAGLGLLFVYVLLPSPSLVARMTGAILFSFVGTLFFFYMLQRVRLKSSLIVPIIGIMIGAIVSAFSTFLGLTFELTQTIEVWFQGSFSTIEQGRYEYLWIVVTTTAAIYVFADRLTVAGLGRDIATNLGLNYQQLIFIANALISVAVGVVSAVIGNLPFLGLIVPNIVSMIRGDDLKSNLPWVALLGMSTMLICDIFARIIIAPFELPVSLILGTLGSFVFAFILLKQRRPA